MAVTDAFPELLDTVRAWREREPDAQFVELLDTLLVEERWDELERYFSSSLSFGTAGLRGAVGFGSAAINLATIARVSWALGTFLLERVDPSAPSAGISVVVGYDARPDSARFAGLCAEVLSGLGLRVQCSDAAVPTPLIAFLVRDQGHAAGIVVTASHNPAGDNGFKVYDGQGVQIVAPWDTQISELMDVFPPWSEVRRNSDLVTTIDQASRERYFEFVHKTAGRVVPKITQAALTVAYTPLHGVARYWVEESVRRSTPDLELHSVIAQAEPDGSFPTTPFPNPEEAGTLDLLEQLAQEKTCALALANDPDGDRLAACLVDVDGALLRLSGDALGLLFADACLRTTSFDAPVIVTTIVSSPAVDRLAERRGARVCRTLTGFKWLCRAALAEPQFVFAYEEALGYCFAPADGSPGVMDKDGVLSAVVLTRLLAAAGSAQALMGILLAIYKEIGLFGSFGVSRRFLPAANLSSQQAMSNHMLRLRAEGPRLADGWSMKAERDFLNGAEERPWYLGAQDLLVYRLERTKQHTSDPDFAEVLVRPSGTEPKLKAYVHLSAKLDESLPLARQLTRLEAFARGLADGFLSLP